MHDAVFFSKTHVNDNAGADLLNAETL